MKTVPSGRFDVCKYGALSFGGTVGAGYVGIDVSAEDVLLKLGMSEAEAVSDADVVLSSVVVDELSVGIAEVVVVASSLLVVVVAASLVVAASVVVAASAVVVAASAVVVAASAVVATSVVVSANTPAVKSDREKTADRSSERFRESRDLPIFA